MEKNEELRLAWEFVEHTGHSIFLTGKAGTGKTTFLKTVRQKSRKNMIVVAPTGVAAINAQGVTIHSFFQIPPGVFSPDMQIKQRFDYSRDKRNIMRTLDLLVIDEISMVRADLLDAIDNVLRRFRNSMQPFGGVQLLMIGDLQQLTPVVTAEEEPLMARYYDTPYFFGSHALSGVNYVTIELKKVYRQQDERFIGVLNDIRDGKVSDADLHMLNSRYVPDFKTHAGDGYIRLTTHNRSADSYNSRQLDALNTTKHIYTAQVDGDFPAYLEPTDSRLMLKRGAQVMFIKNDADGRYYNGKIGYVESLGDDAVSVRSADGGDLIELTCEKWENTKYTVNEAKNEVEQQVVGTFSQLPLRLAWAITIHKSQGLTFEHAVIDAQRAFASGQVYVALSRCKTLEGLVLASPIPPSAVIRDRRVDDYMQAQQQATMQQIASLPGLKQQYERHMLVELFSFQQIYGLEQQLYKTMATLFLAFPKVTQLHSITVSELNTRLMPTADKWTAIIASMEFGKMKDEDFLTRVQRAAKYFKGEMSRLFTTLLNTTAAVRSGNKMAMKRLDNAFSQLKEAVMAKIYLLDFVAVDGYSTETFLTFRQQALLKAAGKGNTSAAHRKNNNGGQNKKEAKPKKERGDSAKESIEFFNQGMTVADIAKRRGLAESTVFGHLAQGVLNGVLSVDDIVPKEHQAQIRHAIETVGIDDGKKSVKEACPETVTWNEVNLMVELEKKGN